MQEHPRSKEHLLEAEVEVSGSPTYRYPSEDESLLQVEGSNAEATPRQGVSFSQMESLLMGKNDELMQFGFDQLLKEEFLSARMYTGPVSTVAPLQASVR